MNIHEYREMMKYLTRPKDKLSKEEKKEVATKFYKETEQPKSKPMPIVKYIDKMNRLYGNGSEDVKTEPEHHTDRIQEMDRANKKKIIKKNLFVKKPVEQQLQFEDWLNIIDPNWLEEEEEKEKPKALIRKPQRAAQGIQTILNLHKKRT